MERPYRFNELLRSLPGLSQKVLTDNLRFMEYSGLIVRTVYSEVPPRVEYSLSELGETMRPIIAVLGEWGSNYQRLVRETSSPYFPMQASDAISTISSSDRADSKDINR